MSNNDNRIKELIEIIEQKRVSLGTKPKTSWNTNGIFKFNESKHINLNTVYDPNIIVSALSHIIMHNSSSIEASKILGVDNVVIEYDGYCLDDWISDFKLRINQINWAFEKKELDKKEEQLKSLISEDARTEMALDIIEKELK